MAHATQTFVGKSHRVTVPNIPMLQSIKKDAKAKGQPFRAILLSRAAEYTRMREDADDLSRYLDAQRAATSVYRPDLTNLRYRATMLRKEAEALIAEAEAAEAEINRIIAQAEVDFIAAQARCSGGLKMLRREIDKSIFSHPAAVIE